MKYNEYARERYRILDSYTIDLKYIWFFESITFEPQESYQDNLKRIEDVARSFGKLRDQIEKELTDKFKDNVFTFLNNPKSIVNV